MAEQKDSVQGKALLSVRIIQILYRESDEAHPLSQQRILELLDERYGMTVDRKSVRRNLLRLKEAGFPLHCREAARTMNGKNSAISLDWYWEHTLSEAEAEMLTELLQFSPLPPLRVRQLQEKLRSFTSRHSTVGAAAKSLPRPEAAEQTEKQRPAAVLLARAIAEKKKILCWNDHYEADGKWHHDRNLGGEERRLKLNPCALFAANGRYFLLGNLDGEEAVRMFYVSRLSGIEITDEPARPQQSLAALENGTAPAQYMEMQESVYFGSPELCTFDMDPALLSDLMENFGKRARVLSATLNSVQAEVEAVPEAAAAWAFRHGGRVKVTGPPHLVRTVKDAVAVAAKLYGGLS